METKKIIYGLILIPLFIIGLAIVGTFFMFIINNFQTLSDDLYFTGGYVGMSCLLGYIDFRLIKRYVKKIWEEKQNQKQH